MHRINYKMKATKGNLAKLESLLQELGFTIRYEKGNFQAGYCIVQHRKVVVINKFFDLEGRINCMMDILAGLHIANPENLSKEHLHILESIKNRQLIDIN